MKFSIIENGVVKNIAEASEEFGLAQGWQAAGDERIGDTLVDGVFVAPAPAPVDPKMAGVSILGVLCSATKDDQSGLSAVALGVTIARMAGQTFPDTKFEFENGNSLVVTDANFDTIYAAWTPFRQSFFTA
jgi:hypothetical protein